MASVIEASLAAVAADAAYEFLLPPSFSTLLGIGPDHQRVIAPVMSEWVEGDRGARIDGAAAKTAFDDPWLCRLNDEFAHWPPPLSRSITAVYQNWRVF
jgi:hypothetical protein